jgi:hypothetical protein
MADITFSLLNDKSWVLIGILSGGGVEIKLKWKIRIEITIGFYLSSKVSLT